MFLAVQVSDLDVVRDLREENQKLQLELQEAYGLTDEKERLAKELRESEAATSTAEKRLTLLQEDLEQARQLSQVGVAVGGVSRQGCRWRLE